MGPCRRVDLSDTRMVVPNGAFFKIWCLAHQMANLSGGKACCWRFEWRRFYKTQLCLGRTLAVRTDQTPGCRWKPNCGRPDCQARLALRTCNRWRDILAWGRFKPVCQRQDTRL